MLLISKIFDLIDKQILPEAQEPKISSVKTTKLRWVALFFFCFITLGGYYCHEIPAPLQTPIMAIFDIKVTQFNLISTAYSLPNCILPIFCGIIIDKLGVRLGLFLYGFLIAKGQAVTTYGASQLSFNSILVGSMIMGVGLEGLGAAKTKVIILWFKNQELAFSMGITLTVSRLGSSLSSFLSPLIYDKTEKLWNSFGFGFLVALLSLLSICVVSLLDYYAETRNQKLGVVEPSSQEIFSVRDIKDFKPIYYLLIINIMLTYGAIIGFLSNASDLMNTRFGSNPRLSGTYLTIVYVLATFFSPIFGKVVDKYGRRILLVTISLCLLIFAHLFIAFMRDTEPGNPNALILVALVCIGIAYASYAAVIWPAIGVVIPEKAIGTATGLAFLAQNVNFSIMAILVGVVHDSTVHVSNGYFWTEILLAFVACLGIAVVFLIRKFDEKEGGIVDGSPSRASGENGEYIQQKDEKGVELSEKVVRSRN